MTREHLDAIRARVDNARYRHWLGDKEALLNNAMNDLLALLAEAERLNTEVEAKVAQNVALIGQNGRLQQEVERLTADPLPAAAWVREVEKAAFKRGVAAMREAAAMLVKREVEDWMQLGLSGDIRALPDPEDKP